jgi:hypothetical protein
MGAGMELVGDAVVSASKEVLVIDKNNINVAIASFCINPPIDQNYSKGCQNPLFPQNNFGGAVLRIPDKH